MKRLIIILFSLCIFATSCVTIQKCKDKFPENYSTTYRDTIYYFKTETDTVYKTGLIIDTVYASTGQAGGQAWVIHDTLHLKVWQKDTVYVVRDSIRTDVKEVIVEKPCNGQATLRLLITLGIILIGIMIMFKIVLK